MKGKECLLLKYYGDYMMKNKKTTQDYIDTTIHNWKTNVEIKPIKGRIKKLTIYTPLEITDEKLVKGIVIKHVDYNNLEGFKFTSKRVISN